MFLKFFHDWGAVGGVFVAEADAGALFEADAFPEVDLADAAYATGALFEADAFLEADAGVDKGRTVTVGRLDAALLAPATSPTPSASETFSLPDRSRVPLETASTAASSPEAASSVGRLNCHLVLFSIFWKYIGT
jgi:hypothetical protein